jgi:hypothetical protein
MILTTHQKEIYDVLYDFSTTKTPYNTILLNASAGTGKTYLLSVLIKQLLKNKDITKIDFICPTHVSLNIAKQKILDQNIILNEKIELSTIHSFLKYKKNVLHDGSIEYKRNYKLKLQIKSNIVIVDECSMIDDLMYHDLIEQCKKNKIIFNGDEIQLPPIGQLKSIVFNSNIKMVSLTEMIRTKSVKITDFVYKHRDCILKNIPIKIGKLIDNNEICLLRDKNKFILHFIENLKSNNILLAYHVKVVENYNKKIRENIFNKEILNYFEIGEYLIFNEHHRIYITNIENEIETIIFNTSEKVKVSNIILNKEKLKTIPITLTKTLPKNINDLICEGLENINSILKKDTFDIYNLTVIKLKFETPYDIKTISNTHIIQYNKMVNELLNILKKIYDDSLNIIEKMDVEMDIYTYQTNLNNKMQKIYDLFYGIIEEYAKLNYGYAMTVHKSQSATFENVYIDIEDIYKNKIEHEISKMLFTAITRASTKLVLFSS